jgi:hypothetical protein
MLPVLAPIVIGLFLPTTEVRTLSQQDYVRVTCVEESCPEADSYLAQGYICDAKASEETRIWCVKNMLGAVDEITQKNLEQKVIDKWKGFELKFYEPRKEPELVLTTNYMTQWQADQKVWLQNASQNVSLVSYDVLLVQYKNELQLGFLDLSVRQNPGEADLWKEETLQQGTPNHFLKSTVRLRWRKQ